MRCINCNAEGHYYKACPLPRKSFGIVFCRVNERTSALEYVLMCRNHSFGFVEMIMGSYDVHDQEQLVRLFKEMTVRERTQITTLPFDELWRKLWSSSTTEAGGRLPPPKKPRARPPACPRGRSHHHHHAAVLPHKGGDSSNSWFHHHRRGRDAPSTYERCANTIAALRRSPAYAGALQRTAASASRYTVPEWVFPKGRRVKNEGDEACACRESLEETGIGSGYTLLPRVAVQSVFEGSDRKLYHNVYRVGICDSHVEPVLNRNNRQQLQEVSDVGWFSYEQCLRRIRPYDRATITSLGIVHHALVDRLRPHGLAVANEIDAAVKTAALRSPTLPPPPYNDWRNDNDNIDDGHGDDNDDGNDLVHTPPPSAAYLVGGCTTRVRRAIRRLGANNGGGEGEGEGGGRSSSPFAVVHQAEDAQRERALAAVGSPQNLAEEARVVRAVEDDHVGRRAQVQARAVVLVREHEHVHDAGVEPLERLAHGAQASGEPRAAQPVA
jgi:8-oxo-dGTP pyrophosphatase MutT (NUDIX family)